MFVGCAIVQVERLVFSHCRVGTACLNYRHRITTGNNVCNRQRRGLSYADNLTPQTLADVVDNLRVSIGTGHVPGIHQHYNALVQTITKLKDTSINTLSDSSLTDAHLLDAVHALAISGRLFDLELINRILADMPDRFGIEANATVHSCVIEGLINNGHTQAVYQWLLSMPQKPGHFTPSLLQWHILFDHCSETGQLAFLVQAASKMHRSGRKPTNETFKKILQALFAVQPEETLILHVFDIMQRARTPYDNSISLLLNDGFSKHQLPDHASQFQFLYKERFWGFKREDSQQLIAWQEDLACRAEKEGVVAAVDLCKSFSKGFRPTRHTLTIVLRHTKSIDDLRYAERELNVRATILHWSILVKNAVRAGDMPIALSLYRECQASGIRPDAPLIHPLIAALCHSTFKVPSDSAIDQALALYRDLVEATSDEMPNGTACQNLPTTLRQHSYGPDSSLYNILLRTLGSSSNIKKYRTVAMSLLQDMQDRNIALSDSMAVSAVTIILMRCSKDYEDAFDAYKRLCRRKTGPPLDAKGFIGILHTFSELSFDGEGVLPSVRYYLEIVKDMWTAGHQITVEVYTILLRQLALFAKDAAGESSDQLTAAIRRVHNHLTLDPSISPDTALWNQLMDTYQRAGCFAEAYRVWEVLFLSGTFDHASVSIILDACGFAGSLSTATRIRSKLLDIGFIFSQRNWHAWLECLCRLGRLNDAVRATCLEMGKDQDDVAPDADTVNLLLIFARMSNQEEEVLSRIERHLPRLWESLPNRLRGSR